MSSLIYWLPPESPSKPNLGMSLFTSFFLLLLLLYGIMPPSSQTFPLIGIYYCINMCLIAASTIMCAIVVHIYQRGTGELPGWLKYNFLDYMVQVLMVGRVQTSLPIERLIASREHVLSPIDSSPVWNKSYRPQMNAPADQYEDNGSLVFLKLSLKDVIAYVRKARARDAEIEIKANRTEDWRRLALVADRVFFIIYVLVTCLITTGLFFQ
ncbi:hypothetical protein ACOME3_006097 [Neoechinorhynchus agilis]